MPERPKDPSLSTRLVDWLGAQKPLNLIAGMVGLIAACSALAHWL